MMNAHSSGHRGGTSAGHPKLVSMNDLGSGKNKGHNNSNENKHHGGHCEVKGQVKRIRE